MEFISKKGRKIEIREIQEKDYVGLRNFINSLVKENTYILKNLPIDKEGELNYVRKCLEEIERRKRVHLVAVYRNKIIGAAEIRRKRFKEKHVGVLGISIRKNYRNEGIGKILMNEVIKRSKEIGIKLIVLDLFKVNKTAFILYKKLGFKKYGELPKALKHKGKYMSMVLMYKWIG
jgi:ribosomal protein S18 acetylase RimI-like enzyme